MRCTGRHTQQAPARRWLQAGAASAGVSAALLGFWLAGPQVGVAAADTTDASATAGPAEPDPAPPAPEPAADTKPAEDTSDPAADTSDPDEPEDVGADLDPDEPVDVDTDSDPEADVDVDTDSGPDTDNGPDPDAAVEHEAAPDVDEPEITDVTAEPARTTQLASARTQTAAQVSATAPVAAAQPAPPPSVAQLITDGVAAWTRDSQAWINSLPVDQALKTNLSGVLWTVRRTFFNQAPVVAPIQISGVVTGPITGSLGAADPEGDWLVYRLLTKPAEGSVVLNPDGTYTYTPGANFDGVDTFRVAAIDFGLHVNLLDWFRPLGTRATSLINQGAIKFAFNYTSALWTAERRAALEKSADDLVTYFRVTAPVLLTFDVAGEDDPDGDKLASAGSDLISGDPGFWRTVVQNKILSGVDANGAAADGSISWNWGQDWGLGDVVAAGDYDFVSTALHELLHAFGFMSTVAAAGANAGKDWVAFDDFVVAQDGSSPIGADLEWNPAYDPNLVGTGGGLYFGGANAVAAYGGLVPLYTPNPWEPGSSMSHLDDATFTGANQQLMNARTDRGQGVRVLSAVEVGILTDLGFHVVPQTSSTTLAFVGLVLLRSRRSRAR